MNSRPTRRSVIGTFAVCSSIAAAGCLGSLPRREECDSGTVGINAEQSGPDSDVEAEIVPVDVDELPEGEREIVETAIRNGKYEDCYPGSDAFQSVHDRAYNNVLEQPDGTSAYAVFRREWYRLSVHRLDEGF